KQTTPRAVLAHISWAKNHMLDPQEVYLQSADPKTERVARIYAEYRKELAKANALDFDDLLLESVRLLKAVPAVREYYNRRFQYSLIDSWRRGRCCSGTPSPPRWPARRGVPSLPGVGGCPRGGRCRRRRRSWPLGRRAAARASCVRRAARPRAAACAPACWLWD